MVSVQASSDAQSQNGDCHTTWTYQTFDRVVDFPVVDLIPTSPGSDTYTYSPPVVEVELSGTEHFSCNGDPPTVTDVTTLVANSCGPSNCSAPDQQFTSAATPNVMIEGTFPFTVPSGTGTFSGTSGWTITGTIDLRRRRVGSRRPSPPRRTARSSPPRRTPGPVVPKRRGFPACPATRDTPKGMPDRIPPPDHDNHSGPSQHPHLPGHRRVSRRPVRRRHRPDRRTKDLHASRGHKHVGATVSYRRHANGRWRRRQAPPRGHRYH